MQELGPMMRALELQRLIEDKVSEWRERSARVTGTNVAESYHQPVNFKRHTNRRKNSAEINRIIAKYSRPNKRTDERYNTHQIIIEAPVRPERKRNTLKGSKSEDNLANIMETGDQPPKIKPPPRFKYKTKSSEDLSAFVDMERSRKSMNFGETSILNSKTISSPSPRPQLHSICEDMDISGFKDSGVEIRNRSFVTSTPISKRKTFAEGISLSVLTMSGFQKCKNPSNSATNLRKGRSEPDLLSASTSTESVVNSKTLDAKKRWSKLKSPFRKATFSFLVPWSKKKKPQFEESR